MKTNINRVLVVSNGRTTISDGFQAAFGRLGIETALFDLSQAGHWFDKYVIHAMNKLAHNLRLLPKEKSLFHNHQLSHRVYRSTELLKACEHFQPALVFHVRGWSILPDVLRRIRAESPVFGWWAEGDHRFDEVLPAVPDYDRFYFFSTAGVQRAQAAGYTHVSYLPLAVDTALYHPLRDLQKMYDWVFVGKWTSHRQAVVDILSRASNRFALFGPGWRSKNRNNPCVLRNFLGKQTTHEQLLGLYSAAKIVVNVTQWGGGTVRRVGMNYRVLEALACSTCLLTDFSEDTALYFEPDRHFVAFDSTEEAASKLSLLLADDEKRCEIAREGYKRVLEGFSFDSRVRTLLDHYREEITN